MATVLEISVGHRTLSYQINENVRRIFCNICGHDVRELFSVTASWKLVKKSNFFTAAPMRLLLSKMVDICEPYGTVIVSVNRLKLRTITISKKTAWSKRYLTKSTKG